jgi:2-oxoisovalerate dehydrogenase E1 component
MQAIPATGTAQGLQYRELQGLDKWSDGEKPITLCSLGDASITEGEVAEAFQMAALHQYPILYLIQDNEWDISAYSSEIRAMDATYYLSGFKGITVFTIDGTQPEKSFETLGKAFDIVRNERRPVAVHAKVPLLNHHTSGVRKEWYRPIENLDFDNARDPYPILKRLLIDKALLTENELVLLEADIENKVNEDFERALLEPSPSATDLMNHIFAPTTITEEMGTRSPENGETIVMVDAALHAVDDILKKHPEALLYGQDVGGELGGVFREAALLAKKYGDKRVFNTPIMEAYIIGSTVGMSASKCKPIVEVQFADYIFPGINQLFTEVSRSCYLSNGKWPVQSLIRIPIGAYGSGGPYHSSSVESIVLQLKGVKVVYPSNAADMKGLMKAAFYDPNPVVIFEHKGLYWSKVKGTDLAKCIEPDEDYIVPLGKARVALAADEQNIANGESLCIITYGMGVHWAMNAAKSFSGKVEVIDLRTLNPLDEELVIETVKKHGKAIVLTEETITHSFAEALAGRITPKCFKYLDAPIITIGSKDAPAIPLNEELEKAMLPNVELVKKSIDVLLNF